MKPVILRIIVLVVLTFIARIFVIFNFDNKPGDSAHHVEAALRILEDPGLLVNFDANASVAYNYWLALSLYLWNQPLLSPRLATVIFGIGIMVPFYFLIRMLFNSRIAFCSGLLLVFYPLHVLQSGYTTSDVVYQFFLISSLYYLFKFKQDKGRLTTLFAAALLLNIAAVLRFESWIFIPVLSLFLYNEGKKYSLMFFFLSLVLPCVWLLLCYHVTKDMFFSFTMPVKTMHAEILLRHPEHQTEILRWLKVLSWNIGYPVVISGLCGVIYAFIRRKAASLAVLFLLLLSIYTVNTMLCRMWHNERYTIMLGILLLPYSLLFIEEIANFLRIKAVFMFLPFIALSFADFNKIYQKPVFYMPNIVTAKLPQGVSDVGIWLKNNVSSQDKIILSSDSYDLFIPDIVIYSRISPKRFFEVYTPLVEPIRRSKEIIMKYINNEKPRFLVMHSSGYLREVLDFDMNQEKVNKFGLTFVLVYSRHITLGNGTYNIYEIIYPDKWRYKSIHPKDLRSSNKG